MSSSTYFATGKRRDRAALVDALLVLQRWGAVAVTSGELEDYAGDDQANALLTADLSHLHRLIGSVAATSDIDPAVPFVEALLAEPRYGSRRHRRRRPPPLDPAPPRPPAARQPCRPPRRPHRDRVRLPVERGGRTWPRSHVAEAGFVLDERADGLLAIDEQARATADTFPGPNGTVHQTALLLVDHLVELANHDSGGNDGGGSHRGAARRPRTRSLTELTADAGDCCRSASRAEVDPPAVGLLVCGVVRGGADVVTNCRDRALASACYPAVPT